MPPKAKATPKREKYARIRQTNLPPEVFAQIEPAFTRLQSVHKVAREIGVSHNTVYRQLRKLGLIPE